MMLRMTGERGASKSDGRAGSALALSHAWRGLGNSRQGLGDSLYTPQTLPYLTWVYAIIFRIISQHAGTGAFPQINGA